MKVQYVAMMTQRIQKQGKSMKSMVRSRSLQCVAYFGVSTTRRNQFPVDCHQYLDRNMHFHYAEYVSSCFSIALF